ncbi:hypothetical protein ALO41_102889 [Pseudomonas amygdali pv. ulmi]|uniref:Uncharacterized protein n=1 Tax=Pseudomonas amygdali pv. ulmi TaxID=251720 RepID=A0A0Q0E9K9_PSEA0|nr:Unknown protein sequence [Pseudomonas amygdali pv. aesculi]KPZ18341.1 hypothetical protein ALO41_102889 [Pseudomonas amygdali pv. ulmi]RMR18544.1 hypothetical protein ALP90_102677 [Pseudomonas amygdali pv. ulmi]
MGNGRCYRERVTADDIDIQNGQVVVAVARVFNAFAKRTGVVSGSEPQVLKHHFHEHCEHCFVLYQQHFGERGLVV